MLVHQRVFLGALWDHLDSTDFTLGSPTAATLDRWLRWHSLKILILIGRMMMNQYEPRCWNQRVLSSKKTKFGVHMHYNLALNVQMFTYFRFVHCSRWYWHCYSTTILLGGLIDLFGFSMNHPAIGVIPFISWFTTPTNCHCHIYIYIIIYIIIYIYIYLYIIDPDDDINQPFGESLYIRSSSKYQLQDDPGSRAAHGFQGGDWAVLGEWLGWGGLYPKNHRKTIGKYGGLMGFNGISYWIPSGND